MIATYRTAPVVRLVKEKPLRLSNEVTRTPADVVAILRDYIEDADREHFVAVLLDTRHRIIGLHTVSIGSLCASIVHPREVFKAAIVANASAVILAHNHPSGDPEPSEDDRQITSSLRSAGEILGIKVIDHVVIGYGGRFYSFQEHGSW